MTNVKSGSKYIAVPPILCPFLPYIAIHGRSLVFTDLEFPCSLVTPPSLPPLYTEVPDAPINVTITNNTQRSQVLSWVVPFDGNRPVTQNIIYFTSSRQSNLTQIYPPLGGGRTPRQTSGVSTDPMLSVTTTDNPTTVIVSYLIPFVEYSYTVVAVNELGRSDMSQPSPSVQTEAASES